MNGVILNQDGKRKLARARLLRKQEFDDKIRIVAPMLIWGTIYSGGRVGHLEIACKLALSAFKNVTKIKTHTHVHTHTQTHSHSHIHTLVHTYTHSYICTFICLLSRYLFLREFETICMFSKTYTFFVLT